MHATALSNLAEGVVDALLDMKVMPRKGTLILSFNNIEAYQRFDARNPFKSRMVDEDFNRTWGRLDRPATTLETRRAQVVKPYVERADLLLDLHSMHDDCVPLMLCGPLDRGVALARKLGAPADIVRDRGHAAGNVEGADVVVADLGIAYSGNIYMNLDVKLPVQRLRNWLLCSTCTGKAEVNLKPWAEAPGT